MANNLEGMCHALREEGLFIRLLDGELSQADENRVLVHLRNCHECLGTIADLLYTDTRLKELFSRKEFRSDIERKEDKKEERKSSQYFMLEVDKLPIGKSLDRDLLDEGGNLLVASGTSLTPALIDSIKRRGISKLAVRTSQEVEVESIQQADVSPVSMREIQGFILDSNIEPVVSKLVRDRCTTAIKDCFKSLQDEGTFSLGDAETSAADVASEILGKANVGLSLADMILADSDLHAHSVNVLVLFLLISRAMGHPAQLIKEHAVGALLHDIGRIVFRRVNATSGMKRGKEVEDAEHAESGYAYLWNFGTLNQSALKMVMNHHERYDGKGYPRSLKGTSLSDWDQLLIFANTFDNIAWDRATGIRSGFHTALSTMIQDGTKYVRKGIITAAVQTFGYYPPGSWIKLNTGEIGIVAKSHPGSPLKPVVTVFYGDDNRKLPKPRNLDLGYSQNAYIQGPVAVNITL